ncbi:hypothetical protein [Streptomyces atroolivaceus]|uniref:hypothetical protein n=1 Tax=Streptomyces atroolivaceus TaxID=66869 RepID=UPI0034205F66
MGWTERAGDRQTDMDAALERLMTGTTSGHNALLRDDDNHLVTQTVLCPAAYTPTRDKPEAMVKLAAAIAATAGLVAGLAVVEAVPHVKRVSRPSSRS